MVPQASIHGEGGEWQRKCRGRELQPGLTVGVKIDPVIYAPYEQVQIFVIGNRSWRSFSSVRLSSGLIFCLRGRDLGVLRFGLRLAGVAGLDVRKNCLARGR